MNFHCQHGKPSTHRCHLCAPRREPKRHGAYCGRCGCVYITTDWPGPGACDLCTTGVADFHHDLPLGLSWVST